jgi:hypothetical protein
VRFALQYPNHYRLMFMTPKAPGAIPAELLQRRGNPGEDAYAFLRKAVAEAIAEGRLRPEYTDADQVSQTFWPAVHGLASLHITHAKDEWIDWRPLEVLVDTMVDVTLRGVLRDPAELEAIKARTNARERAANSEVSQ